MAWFLRNALDSLGTGPKPHASSRSTRASRVTLCFLSSPFSHLPHLLPVTQTSWGWFTDRGPEPPSEPGLPALRCPPALPTFLFSLRPAL